MQRLTPSGALRFLRASNQTKVQLLRDLNDQWVAQRRSRKWRGAVTRQTPFVFAERLEPYLLGVTEDSLYQELYVYGEAEFAKVKTALSLLERESMSTFIDVGANIGHLSIPGLRRGYFETAIAFEPDPINFALCAVNSELNGVSDRVTLFHAAAGDGSATSLPLALSGVEFGDHRVAVTDELRTQRRVIDVPACTLDETAQDVKPEETLIWIDVQGYEVLVLRGAARLLAAKAPLCLEFWPEGITQGGGSLNEVLELLAPYVAMANLDRPNEGFVPITALHDLWRALLSGEYGRNFVDVLVK